MRILSATLFTNDVAATSDFYSRVLGLPLHLCDTRTADLGAGQSRLLFRSTITHNPVYHIAFNIPFAQVEEAALFMADRTELIPHEGKTVIDFSAWNAKAFYFRDNNGNILEFIGRKDLEQKAAAPFTLAAISCISEVAIVTENVKSLSEKISADTGVSLYEKQPFHENFAAMGDENGLFILSAVNRNWFPTEIPAMKFPLRIKAEINGRIYPLEFNC